MDLNTQTIRSTEPHERDEERLNHRSRFVPRNHRRVVPLDLKILKLRRGVHAFPVGAAFMRGPDPVVVLERPFFAE